MILDLHLHSKYSDGLFSPRVMAKHVKKLGLDGFALVDHDTVAGLKEARLAAKEFELEFVPGIEVSSDQGHVVALGIENVIGRGPLDKTLERIEELGGISVAVHPYDPFRHGVGSYVKRLKFDYIEAFNSRALLPTFNTRAERVAKKLGVPMLAGSDAHDLTCIGLGTSEVGSIEGLYRGKAIMHRRRWAGMFRLAMEKSMRILNRLSKIDQPS